MFRALFSVSKAKECPPSLSERCWSHGTEELVDSESSITSVSWTALESVSGLRSAGFGQQLGSP
jgi:hypothetical protein